MKDSILARSEREGATIGSTSSEALKGPTAIVGSTKVSSTAGIALEVGVLVKASPHDLLDVPVLGLALFIYACLCLR